MAQQKTALEPTKTTAPIITDDESLFEQFKETAQTIGKRAFELFESRGRQFGNSFEDWLRAENELIRRVPIEIKEVNGSLDVRAEVPGFKPEELKVLVEPRRITISGETEQKTEKTDANTLYSEWRTQKISRSFDLPREVKPKEVVAKLNDGVLTLTMPKVEMAEPLEVEVKNA